MMMRTVRNLTFVGLLATVHLTGGMNLAGDGKVMAASAAAASSGSSCSFEPTGMSNPAFVGSCPWAAGCGEALDEAIAFCISELGPMAYVWHFWCIDPLEPPTDFSFNCGEWPTYD